jgi:hypothetical protein
MQAKYDGRGNVREHILKMIVMSNKLKDLECPLPESYVIHYIMILVPSCFGNFKINYNSSDKKWITTELIANLSQEEERLRTENGRHIVNFTKGPCSGYGKFLRQKGKGKKPYDPQKKLLKMSLMRRKVPSVFIVRNKGTQGGNLMNSRHGSPRRVMTLFSLLMSHPLLIFSLIHGD